MAAISNLGYVVFGVSDLARWEAFAVDLMGFQVGRREPSHLLTLRMDGQAQRIVLEHGPEDDLLSAGWQLDTPEELAQIVEQLRAHGVKVEDCGREKALERRVERLFVCDDPNGFKHEFYVNAAVAPATQPFSSAVLKGPGFVAGPLGVGHVLPRSLDYAASVDWYSRVLGLKVSDHIREQITPDRVGEATFFHAATGRHHSLATAYAPTAKVLAHLMVEVQDLDDVGFAFDRCTRAGYVPYRGLGRHTNDRMLSFYVKTPSGFALEYGYGGIVIDDEKWEVVTHDKRSEWGHVNQPPLPA